MLGNQRYKTKEKVLPRLWKWLGEEVRKHGKEKNFDSKLSESYSKELYRYWIPELLKARISFSNLDIAKKYVSFIEKLKSPKQKQMASLILWDFLIAFAIKSSAMWQDVAKKMKVICEYYPYPMYQMIGFEKLLRLPLRKGENKTREDKVTEEQQTKKLEDEMLQNKIEELAGKYFYQVLNFYLNPQRISQHTVSDDEIVSLLKKNPDLLKWTYSERQGYQFLNGVSQEQLIIDDTLFIRAVLLKQDPVFCRQLLDIMEDKKHPFDEAVIKNILGLPKRNLRIDACLIGDDRELFKRVAKYDQRDLTEEDKVIIVSFAIQYNRIDILNYLKDDLNFDMRVIGKKALALKSKKNPAHQAVIFLLDQGVDVNAHFAPKEGQNYYLLEHLLDPDNLLLKLPYREYGSHFADFVESLDDNLIQIALAFMRHHVNLQLIQEHHQAYYQQYPEAYHQAEYKIQGNIIKMFWDALDIKSKALTKVQPITDAMAATLSNIVSLQKWLSNEMVFIEKLQDACKEFEAERKKPGYSLENQPVERICQILGVEPIKQLGVVKKALMLCRQRLAQSSSPSKLKDALQNAYNILVMHELKNAFYQYQHFSGQASQKQQEKEYVLQDILMFLNAKSIDDAIARCKEKLEEKLNSNEDIYKKALNILLEEQYIKKLRPFYNNQLQKGVIPKGNNDTDMTRVRETVKVAAQLNKFLSLRQQKIVGAVSAVLEEKPINSKAQLPQGLTLLSFFKRQFFVPVLGSKRHKQKPQP